MLDDETLRILGTLQQIRACEQRAMAARTFLARSAQLNDWIRVAFWTVDEVRSFVVHVASLPGPLFPERIVREMREWKGIG